MGSYSPHDDYCAAAAKSQSVLSAAETKQSLLERGKAHEPENIERARLSTQYSCPDSYHMGSIQDNQIYIATTNDQHDQIASGCHVDAQGGLSGYFSDQATIDACKSGDALDNTKYNEMCQIAPHRDRGINETGDATYKPHIDCFDIDRDALFRNYGTHDFNAAIAKCEANTQFGAGGGNQGYNPHLSEMIDNGTLRHNPGRSFSDDSICTSAHCNPNALSNSTVSACDCQDMMRSAQTRAQDCVANNTPHPSAAACNNGFPPNPNPIESPTGNARPVEKGLGGHGTADQTKGEIEIPKRNPAASNTPSEASALVPSADKGLKF